MKTTTLKKRMAERGMLRKDGKMNEFCRIYVPTLEDIAKGIKLHPYHWTKSRGHWKITGESYAEHIIDIIVAFGCRPVRGNDAPKGGKDGDFICVAKNELRKFRGWLAVYKSATENNEL